MKVLVTGFAPFGGETSNPSYEAVKGLPESLDGITICTAKIPVSYEKSRQTLDDLLKEENPDIVLLVGQAGRRAAITPEYVAINLQNAEAADNDGVIKKECPVEEKGETAYFSNLPVGKITEALRAAEIPAQLSYSAGAYVCNTLMYHLLYRIHTEYKTMWGGFLHVPFSCSQVAGKAGGAPSLPLSMMTEALLIAIRVCVKEKEREKGSGV